MSQLGHLEDLRAQHARLHTQIEEELARVSPDEVRVQELKREKLKIKDEIARQAPH